MERERRPAIVVLHGNGGMKDFSQLRPLGRIGEEHAERFRRFIQNVVEENDGNSVRRLPAGERQRAVRRPIILAGDGGAVDRRVIHGNRAVDVPGPEHVDGRRSLPLVRLD